MKQTLGFKLLDSIGKTGGVGGIAAATDCRLLRNWVTQFGYEPGRCAGDERIPEAARAKFIDQIGAYLGWTPPPNMNWTIEVDLDTGHVAFFRHLTDEEKERLLGYRYQRFEKTEAAP